MHKLLHHAIEMFAMKRIYGEINFLEANLYPECIISAGISAKLAEQRNFGYVQILKHIIFCMDNRGQNCTCPITENVYHLPYTI